MSTEIKTNCDKHRLWHHCLGEKTAEKVFWSCCPFRNPWLSFLVRVCQQQFQQWFVAHCVALFEWKRSISETIQPPKRNFSIKWTNKNLMKDKYELSAGKPGSDLLPHCCTFEKIRQYILFLLLLQTHYQQICHLSPKCFWSWPVKEGQSKKEYCFQNLRSQEKSIFFFKLCFCTLKINPCSKNCWRKLRSELKFSFQNVPEKIGQSADFLWGLSDRGWFSFKRKKQRIAK